VQIHTIGFTQKSAEQFFELLREAGIQRLIDVRIHNSSQLAGFSKGGDLRYFLRAILDAEYVHEPLLAPTEELLVNYRKKRTSWDSYVHIFNGLLAEREIASTLDKALFDRPAVLLCSEPTADQCHRRLVAEYLQRHWDDVTIVHL
jgi:uncharacterized protein (DUF488 family)